MPNIREYTSRVDKLTPDDRGYTAWETAGRRIGPLYQQEATDIEKGGKLTAQEIEQAGKAHSQELTQADKFNTLTTKYLEEIGNAKGGGREAKGASFSFGEGGGRGGGGGGHLLSDIASSGADLAMAAYQSSVIPAQPKGHVEGRGLYSPPDDTTSTGYNPLTGETTSEQTHEDPGSTGGTWFHHTDAPGTSSTSYGGGPGSPGNTQTFTEDPDFQGGGWSSQQNADPSVPAASNNWGFPDMASYYAYWSDKVSSVSQSLAYSGSGAGASPTPDTMAETP